ncbi:MAG: hypothetical protein VB108_12020 [Anaerolineaceae bacterium]|nr:hypothetical protein [Anaerolineaceae bacterium]
MPKTSHRSLPEESLASYQSLQTGNNCGLYALSAAIRLLCNLDLSPAWLIEETNRLWWRGRFFRIFPDWAITPHQLAHLTNYLAAQKKLPIKASVWHLSRQILRNLLADPNLACLITLYWCKGKSPAIYHWNSPININTHNEMSAHTMLAAAYDPSHYNTQISTPWGFINSWIEQSQGLFWMSEKDFEHSWGFSLPVLANHATVLISRTED